MGYRIELIKIWIDGGDYGAVAAPATESKTLSGRQPAHISNFPLDFPRF